MKLANVWYDYSFWFKVSLIMILFWFIFALSLSLVAYFAWPYYVHNFDAIVFRFLIWFFMLPGLAILGISNSIPFIAKWLFHDMTVPKKQTSQNPKKLTPRDPSLPPQPLKKQHSYQDVSAKLTGEKESHGQSRDDTMPDFDDYDDF